MDLESSVEQSSTMMISVPGIPCAWTERTARRRYAPELKHGMITDTSESERIMSILKEEPSAGFEGRRTASRDLLPWHDLASRCVGRRAEVRTSLHDPKKKLFEPISKLFRPPIFGCLEAFLAFVFVELRVVPEADDSFQPRLDFFGAWDFSRIGGETFGNIEKEPARVKHLRRAAAPTGKHGNAIDRRLGRNAG